MKDLKFFLMFIIGFAVGISVAMLFSDLLRPYFPEVLKPEKEVIEGKVIDKELKRDRLLLTVSAPQGAILVTFNKKVSEIDLLIEEDDTITLGLYQYDPFVNNPTIKRVMKAERQMESTTPIPTPDDSPSIPVPGAERSPESEKTPMEKSLSF